MPMFDRQCTRCERVEMDQLEPSGMAPYPCGRECCEGEMVRVWLSSAPGVIPDDIPGGALIQNGLCNLDGTPRKYYSKSEIAKAAKEKGLINYVVHRGTKGGDKSKHTTRWT